MNLYKKKSEYGSIILIAFVRKHLFTELDISCITPGVQREHQPGSVTDCVAPQLPQHQLGRTF